MCHTILQVVAKIVKVSVTIQRVQTAHGRHHLHAPPPKIMTCLRSRSSCLRGVYRMTKSRKSESGGKRNKIKIHPSMCMAGWKIILLVFDLVAT